MPIPIDESAMHRTIHRQPVDWRGLIARDPTTLDAAAAQLRKAARILLVGTGTSYHAAQLGACLLRMAGRFAWAEHSHDFASYPFPVGSDDAVVVVTHTGWKQYSVRCIQRARATGAWCLAITGENTSIAVDSIAVDGSPASPDYILHTVEQEQSAAYTASYTSALLVLAQLASRLGATDITAALDRLPTLAEEVLSREDELRAWAHKADLTRRFMYVGAGLHGWTAAEGALKAKEASYVTAEGMALEHWLHGPMAGTEPVDYFLLINVPGPFTARTAEITRLVHEIGLNIFWVGMPPIPSTSLPGFSFGETLEVLSPLVAVLPLQLLACYLAEARGVNPDIFHMDVEPYARPVRRFLEQKQF